MPDEYITLQNTSLVVAAPGLKGNDFDPDGDEFLVSNYFPPSNGTLPSIITNGSFTYVPDTDFIGTDSFSYTLQDVNLSFSESVTVEIEVIAPGGENPIVVQDHYLTTEGVNLAVPAPGIKGNDIDPDGDDFIVSNFFSPTNGILSSIVTNGAFTYVPGSGFVGSDAFRYVLFDTQENFSDPDTVFIDVIPNPNRPPIGTNDYYGTPVNTTLTVAAPGLMINDLEPDGDSFIVSNYFAPSNGTVTSIVTNGSFVYVPDVDFIGVDMFYYILADEHSLFAERDTVTIFVGIDPQLPVELTSFDGLVHDHDVVLRWSTASEVNNSGFAVQHAKDGEFVEIGFVEGAGNTNELTDYTYRISGLEPGSHSFRLKQIDFDGAFTYSAVIELFIELPGGYFLSSSYPNPFGVSTSMTLILGHDQHVLAEAMDVLGRPVASLYDGQIKAGERNDLVFDASNLPSGLYLIRVTGETFTVSRTVTLAN